MKLKSFLILFLIFLCFGKIVFSHGNLPLPPNPPPEVYGDVLINRASSDKEMIPVVFSHWIHRVRYTCNVCHTELEFAMKANETLISCESMFIDNKFCGFCHNGKIAFGRTGPDGKNCELCHNAQSSPSREKFYQFKEKMPSSKYGNEIDWVKALKNELIKPKNSLSEDISKSMKIDKTLILKAEMSGIPSAIFPHGIHEEWLDCSNCHPELFNIKKKTTRNLTMQNILNKDACGLCHLYIAFPLNDCKRCHPGMKR